MLRQRRVAVAFALGGVILVAAVAGFGVGDVDGDSVSALAELEAGTDPWRPDSDGDGLADGETPRFGTDPLAADSDGDGLPDGVEVAEYATDPLAADSDGDGLPDGVEVDDADTDPTAVDTDGDGLPDRIEVETYDTDPRAPDSDGDVLADGAEVDAHGSSPTSSDSDEDGLADGREVRALGTDAAANDSDADDLADRLEVDGYGTDPTNADTDGDGLRDGVEAAGSGPLAAADPLARDVFVELDYMRGERPTDDAISLVEERFAAAPVENPDGSTGVALHVVVDDAVPREPSTSELDSVRLRLAHFDNESRGYHHALVAVDARLANTSVAGFATTGHVVIQTTGGDGDAYTTRGQAHVLMHELGHALGLSTDRYAGIDSYAVSYDRYASIMNYNAPWEDLGYSTDGAFDDWAYLETDMYAPPALAATLPIPTTANGTTGNGTAGNAATGNAATGNGTAGNAGTGNGTATRPAADASTRPSTSTRSSTSHHAVDVDQTARDFQAGYRRVASS